MSSAGSRSRRRREKVHTMGRISNKASEGKDFRAGGVPHSRAAPGGGSACPKDILPQQPSINHESGLMELQGGEGSESCRWPSNLKREDCNKRGENWG